MSKRYSTFFVNNQMYGFDVLSVQEVTKSMAVTEVPLAPNYVEGLINLRGQIATAISLGKLFGTDVKQVSSEKLDCMNVVCKSDGNLVAFIVDQVGDVLDVEEDLFENTPDTMPMGVGKFMVGVYKTPGRLLSILDVSKIVAAI